MKQSWFFVSKKFIHKFQDYYMSLNKAYSIHQIFVRLFQIIRVVTLSIQISTKISNCDLANKKENTVIQCLLAIKSLNSRKILKFYASKYEALGFILHSLEQIFTLVITHENIVQISVCNLNTRCTNTLVCMECIA